MDSQVKLGKGLFVLRGELVDYIEQLLKTFYRISEFFDAEKLWIPSHISNENVKKTGYLDGFENQASMIQSVHGDELGMCSPTVCHHCYCMLEDTKITNKAFVSHGKCTRIEETGDSLERLFNFTMSEIIFVGDEKYCEESISDCLGYFRQYFYGIGLDFKLEKASDPFFGTKAELKKKAQKMSGSKIEIICNDISVGSINFHKRKFVDNFKIESESTACVAWGLERLLHVLLIQKTTPLVELKWNDFQKYTNIKPSWRMNSICFDYGWHYIDGLTYWVMEKDLTNIEKGDKNNNFQVIDSIDKVHEFETELKNGIEKMHHDLIDWEEKWDFNELINRINQGCILYINILDNKAVQWQWFWFGKFKIEDHNWNYDFELPQDCTFSGHWWVDSKYRRKRGLFFDFYQDQWYDLKSRGYNRDLSYSDGWNINALRACFKLSYVGSDWFPKYKL